MLHSSQYLTNNLMLLKNGDFQYGFLQLCSKLTFLDSKITV